MDRKTFNALCAALPGAEPSHPSEGDLDSWKVGGKMFATFNQDDTGVSLKTPDVETAALLIEMGRAERARYFHKSWVHIRWDMVEPDELTERLHTSYRIVRAGLTKKAQAGMAAF